MRADRFYREPPEAGAAEDIPGRMELFAGEAFPTLRDQFAIAALSGVIAAPVRLAPNYPFDPGYTWADQVAGDAYAVADAMLKARAK